MKSFLYSLKESVNDFSDAYNNLKSIASRWSQSHYVQSDFFKNMQIKFGDKATQYLDKIMLSRKLPTQAAFQSKMSQLIPESKMELFNKVMDFYASIKRLD